MSWVQNLSYFILLCQQEIYCPVLLISPRVHTVYPSFHCYHTNPGSHQLYPFNTSVSGYLSASFHNPQTLYKQIILKHSFHHNKPLLNIFPSFPNTDLPVQALYSAQSLHLCLVLFHAGNIIHPNPNYTSWFMWMDSIMTLIQTDLSSQLLGHFLYLLNNQALAVQWIHETISL